MSLCHSCRDVLRFANDTLNTIHSTSQSFLAAVDEGCYICHGLFCQLPQGRQQDLRRRIEVSEPPARKRRKQHEEYWVLTWYEKDVDNPRSGSIRLDLRMTDLGSGTTFELSDIPEAPRMSFYPVKAPGNEGVIPARLPWTVSSFSTKSEETFTKIKSWIDICDKTHAKCRIRRDEADPSWHPTRLIEITTEGQNGDELEADDLKCRVVELKSNNTTQNLRYITLSHRWPQNQWRLQKLTLDKLPRWKASLPLQILERTFRDAFQVAHKMGINYVWIDSLCIIQDGDEFADWSRESPMMQKVYSQAEFNMCASRSRNDQGVDDEGIFSPREPSNFQSLHVRLLEDDDTTVVSAGDGLDSVGSKRGSGHYLITKTRPITVWDERMKDSILAGRGWIFQEQLLSRANLHFGNHEVFFECLQMRASESLGSDQDYEVPWDHEHVFFKELLPLPASGEESPQIPDESSISGYDYDKLDGDSYNRWHELLSQYTTLHLTNFEDRLVALSGVAQYFKFFSRTGNDLYIAGLWHSRMARELLWQMAAPKTREKRSEQKQRRRHFTFSWLSVKGQIENKVDGGDHSQPCTPLADIKVVRYRASPDAGTSAVGKELPFTEDIFSLSSTPTVEIRLTGFLRPMSLVDTGSLSSSFWPSVDVLPDGYFNLVIGGHSGVRQVRESRWGYTMLDSEVSTAELDELNSSGRLFLMPLVHESKYRLWLLLLERVGTREENNMGRFRRIGVHHVEVYWGVEGQEWLFSFIGRQAMEESYASKLGIYEGVSELPLRRYNYGFECPKQQTIFLV